MTKRPQLKISSISDTIHTGNDATVEMRKDSKSDWIDMSSIVSSVDLHIAVGEAVTAKLTLYPTAVVINGHPITTLLLDEELVITEHPIITNEEEDK